MRILKGYVETTDPAIAFGKAIIDAANAVQQATVAGIESGIRLTKETTQALKDQAHSAMKTIELNLGIAVGTLPATVEGT